MNTAPSAAYPPDSLASVLASRALTAVVLHFVLDPSSALHFRAIQRTTGVASRSLQHELARLEALGLVRREREGRLVRYRAALDNPRWSALRELVRQFVNPPELLRVALGGVPGVAGAFLYGSFAKPEDVHAGSDVDVLAVSDGVASEEARAALAERALEAAGLLGREVNVTTYTPERLRARRGSPFLRSVLAGPRTWLVGSETVLGSTQELAA